MVTLGFHGYQWVMESNFIDFLVCDIGCLGVSTRIRLLKKRDVDYDEDLCKIITTASPILCGDDLGTSTEYCKSSTSGIAGGKTVRKLTKTLSDTTKFMTQINNH